MAKRKPALMKIRRIASLRAFIDKRGTWRYYVNGKRISEEAWMRDGHHAVLWL